jgi:hypothetical protein
MPWGGLSPADWDSLIELSRSLGITLLIYQEIKKSKYLSDLVPSAVREKFKGIYIDNLARNERLLYEALEAIKLFKDNGITLIALKGLALINDVYDDIALRPMVDIDLLVKREDISRAADLLSELGYSHEMPCREKRYFDRQHLPQFLKNKKTRIELHYNIVSAKSPFKIDISGLWQRLRLVKLKNIEMHVFSYEDLLLHLCIHASFHHKFITNFVPFCDIAKLLNTPLNQFDWQVVIERAYKWRAAKCVYLALLITQEFLAAKVPDSVMDALKPHDFKIDFLKDAEKQLFNENFYDRTAGIRARNLANIFKIKRLKRGVIILFRGMFPSKEFIACCYPVSLSSPKIYLYYALRLFRLIFSYSCLLFKLILHNHLVAHAAERQYKEEMLCDWMAS